MSIAVVQSVRKRRAPWENHRRKSMRALEYLKHIDTLEGFIRSADREESAQILNGLCQLLETGTASITSHRKLRVSRAGRALKSLMRRDGFLLPSAIYEAYEYESNFENALRTRNISRRLARRYSKLTASAGREIGSWQRSSGAVIDWKAEVDGSREDIEIWISQDAMEDIFAISLEGYLVSAGRGKPFTEVYATCFGSMKEERFSDPESGIWYMRHFHIDKILPQIRSKATPASVLPSRKTLEKAHLQVAASVFPHLAYLGDFHTHPYPSAAAIARDKLWRLTRADRIYTRENLPMMLELGCPDRVMLILALGRGRRVRSKKYLQGHVQPFKVGPCICYLAGYKVLDNGQASSERIRLHCPSRSL